MTGVTPQGFIPKTQEEIVDSIVKRANDPAFFGREFPTTPDSVFGVFTTIIAASLKDQWDLTQSLAEQQNRDKAEGKYLDDLATLVGISRLKASGSNGRLAFTGNNTAVVPNRAAVNDNTGRIVLTDNSLTLNRATCYSSTFKISSVVANEDYTITVESADYTVNSGANPTEESILLLLQANIGDQTNYNSELIDEGLTLLITYNGYNNLLTTTNSDNILLNTVTSLVDAEAIDEGSLIFTANSLTTIVSPVSGISSVTNPVQFTVGREEETDEELRLRMSTREQSTGTATKPAIEASLLEIQGVTYALVKENDTMTTDSDGVPPKSYETFITGGDENDIAKVVFTTKPAGISTHGDITRTIVDANGDNQTVKFSRPTPKYVWVKVVYSLNQEEEIPADIPKAVRDAVLSTGNSRYAGEDLVPNKFYGNIYRNVTGIFVNDIQIAVTNLPTDTPVYGNDIIPVLKTENTLFDSSRILVSI